ncbi:hypothetical protein ACTG9Q_23715 [Actinokineospora sp. 24-640]
MSTEWAPQSCTLPTVERPLREAEFDGLFATGLRGVLRSGPTTLRLVLAREVAAQVTGLAVRETDCCSFFTFDLRVTGDGLTLEISVPAARADVLDALAARAVAVLT